jgi:hypothetical protein
MLCELRLRKFNGLMFILCIARRGINSLMFIPCIARCSINSLMFILCIARRSINSLMFIPCIARCSINSLMFIPCIARRSINNQHCVLNYITGKHNERNHNTPAHRPYKLTLYDIPPICFRFQVTHTDVRSSLMMADFCRNM